MLKYFAFMFVTHHNLMAFFLLYLIFNIRFNFCITMLVYLNAVRPKHRPCLSLQRKIDRFLFQQTLFVHFFLLHFLNLLLFIHVHFYYSIFLITACEDSCVSRLRFTAGWARAGSRVRPFKPTNSVSNPNRCAARAILFEGGTARATPRLLSLSPRRGDIVRRARHRSEPPARSLAHRAPPRRRRGLGRIARASRETRRGACRPRSSR